MSMPRTAEETGEAYRELESSICDVVDMAAVCWVLMERYQDEARDVEGDPRVGREASLQLLQSAAKPLVFSVYHLDDMVRALKAKYYAELKVA